MLRLTNSEMSEWRRCKRKWWLKNHLRLSSPTEGLPGSALALGNLVHDALAAYYDPETKVDPVAFVVAAGERMAAEDPVLIEAIEADVEMARILLSGYLEWAAAEAVDQDLVITGSERFVEVQMAEDVTLLSKLDAVVERTSDGARLALEHKSVGTSLEVKLEGAKLDTQYLTEHLVRFLEAKQSGATAEEALDKCQGILLNMLRKVKRTARANPPFYAREAVTHNVHELRHHWHHVLAIAREIQDAHRRLGAGESHHTVCYPNPMQDCSWSCPLFKICVMADDGSDFEGALAANFEEKDPLERYADAISL